MEKENKTEKAIEKVVEVKEAKKEIKKDLGNAILISNKPIGAYILAGKKVMETNDELVIKARGRAINTAVNVAEIMKREKLKVKEISTSTETFTKDGKEISVSSINLILTK